LQRILAGAGRSGLRFLIVLVTQYPVWTFNMTISAPMTRKNQLMFRLEVAVLLSVVSSGVWMGLPGCSSSGESTQEQTQRQPRAPQFGTQAALEDLVDRTGQMDSTPLQAVSGPRVSDNFPDVELVSHRRQTLRFRSDLVSNRIVCFAMFYTRCKGTCPGTISKVLALRRSLSAEFGPKNIHFVCITLDTEHDNPEQLQKYADLLGVKDSPELADIHFCTGTHENVDTVRRTLGMYDLDPEVDADRTQHAAMLVIGNDRFNRWASTPSGIKLSDLHETALRIAGESEKQRFAARFAVDSGFSLTALREAEGAEKSCCEAGQSEDAACCSEKTTNQQAKQSKP
jgi:protein SCO1/2